MSTPRSYESERRSAQAAETRSRIVAAARTHFIARGFSGTTIEAIARSAGVSVATVYATFKSKGAILLQLLDAWETAADVQSLRDAVSAAAGDPLAQLQADVDFHVRFFTQGADLVAAVRAAGSADTQFDELRREGEARRRAWHTPLVKAWARQGALREDVSEQEAVDVMFAMSSDIVYTLYVRDLGWSTKHYAQWLFRTLSRLLFRDAATPDD